MSMQNRNVTFREVTNFLNNTNLQLPQFVGLSLRIGITAPLQCKLLPLFEWFTLLESGLFFTFDERRKAWVTEKC